MAESDVRHPHGIRKNEAEVKRDELIEALDERFGPEHVNTAATTTIEAMQISATPLAFGRAKRLNSPVGLAQQVGQLGKVNRQPARLVAGQPVGRRASAALVLEIESSRAPARWRPLDEASVVMLLDRLGRRDHQPICSRPKCIQGALTTFRHSDGIAAKVKECFDTVGGVNAAGVL